MKKLLSILLSLVSVICFACAFTGCGEEKIEITGAYYYMDEACENGWLSEEDIKSIACVYYDYWFSYEENPYAGYFTSSEELSESVQKELKKAYLVQKAFYLDSDAEASLDKVRISRCYGIYNCNIVVYVYAQGICIEPAPPEDKEFGGVMFKDFWFTQIFVYHKN